jgi:hypothetical protein
MRSFVRPLAREARASAGGGSDDRSFVVRAPFRRTSASATFRSPGIRFQERSTRASAPDASGILHMHVVDSVGISGGPVFGDRCFSYVKELSLFAGFDLPVTISCMA